MANEITEKRFTFTEAALAAGLTPKQLRNWLDKDRGYGLVLDAETEREGDGWRRFSIVDVLRIKFIDAFVESCLSVKESARVTEKVVKSRLGLLMMYKNTPVNAIKASFKQTWLMVWRNQNGEIETDIAPRVDMLRGGLFPSKFIVISPHELVSEVFEKLDLEDDSREFIDGYEYLSDEEFEEFQQAHRESIKELIGLFESMKIPGQFGPDQLERFGDVWKTVDEQMRILRFLKPFEPTLNKE